MEKYISGTKEWAKYSANSTIGCHHNCLYCYSRDAFLKKNPDANWTEEARDESRFNFNWGKKDGVIMFPTTHDITPYNVEDCLIVLKKMLSSGNDILIVSKPHLSVIERLINELSEYKDKILFRFTIGTHDNKILKLWEPGAPDFEERMSCLKACFESGFETSVSMEPFLSLTIEDLLNTVLKVEPYVTNSIWIGKMNKIDSRVKGVSADILNSYEKIYSDKNIWKIYNLLKNNNKIKWKESIKKVVGLELSEEAGLDI